MIAAGRAGALFHIAYLKLAGKLDLNDARDLIGGQWPAFLGAVFDPQVRSVPGGVQQYVWQSLRNDYLSRGEPLPVGSFQAVNRLLSLAGSQRAAQANLGKTLDLFNRTGLDQSITAAHISSSIDSNLARPGALGPQYRITYLTKALVGGTLQESYQTHDAGYALPQSASGIQDLIDAAAQITAADYGYEWTGEAVPVSIQSY